MSIEQIILTLSYFGILLLMTSNGIIAFPSSQLIYIIAGYFAFTNDLNLFLIILVGALGHSLGNYILYEISRKKGMDYSIKFIKYLFQFQDPKKEIKKFQIAFNKRSKTWLFIGKLANPSKIFIPIPAGIAKMNRIIFLLITYITSAIWASVFVLIGYYFGKSYENFGYIGAIMIVLFIIIMSYFYKLMNSKEILEQLEKEEQEEKQKKKETIKKRTRKTKNKPKTNQKKTNKYETKKTKLIKNRTT